MRVKNKRILKNGAVGGYVQQSDGSYRWRIISGPSSSTPSSCLQAIRHSVGIILTSALDMFTNVHLKSKQTVNVDLKGCSVLQFQKKKNVDQTHDYLIKT